MLLAATRSVASGDADRATDGLEKANEDFQTDEEQSRPIGRVKNGFLRILSGKNPLFGSGFTSPFLSALAVDFQCSILPAWTCETAPMICEVDNPVNFFEKKLD